MKNKKRRRIIRFSLLSLAGIYIFWLCFQLISFRRPAIPEENISDKEIVGAYHIHSKYSDGWSKVEKIAKKAKAANLDFIIFTDHGRPNYEGLADQGWKEGVLVTAGSELSVSRGHLVALGFNTPSRPFSQNAEEAVYGVMEKGGFTIIAHPYSKVRWTWGRFVDYSGMEIMNADTLVKKHFLSLIPFLPAFVFKPDLVLLKICHRPDINLRKWDSLNTVHHLYGYYSVDAHLLYGPLFNLFHIHIPLQEPLSEDFIAARKQVFTALREGRFFNAIDSAAPSHGFRFWAEKTGEKIPMGSAAAMDTPVFLQVTAPFPFATETRIIRNGEILERINSPSHRYRAALPGTYRVEVYLRLRTPLDNETPWILSNPIFIQGSQK
ncbi:MAG: PHP domain-containing protein [Candidatus Aminicenantes bacterium]|nr:PHP domain-containing protein [Candidatus Aminicenantes bacterium]